jgi:hypothetical protein
MDEQELQARLRAADRARGTESADSWIDDLVEATMSTDPSNERPRQRRTWAMVAAAAAVVATIGVGAAVLTAGDDDGDGGRSDAPEAKAKKELALSLAPADPMQMCIVFSPEALKPMEVAFSGKAYDVEGDTVRLAPDHWYRGGDGADDVVLTAGSADVLLEGGIAFEDGQRYLVSAIDGQVATCGLSAPYSEEMAAAYDEAFGD